MLLTAGTPCKTVKPSISVTTSLPVPSVTLRGPGVALSRTVIGTDASVGPFTVTVPTMIPEPKKAPVTPFAKLVNAPFRITVALVPCTADTGLMAKSVGWPGVTVKPPTCCAISLPVVMMTVREPSPAPGLTLTFNVACVASLTDTELTVIPAPTLAVVVPFRKCVNCPTMFRFSVSA